LVVVMVAVVVVVNIPFNAYTSHETAHIRNLGAHINVPNMFKSVFCTHFIHVIPNTEP